MVRICAIGDVHGNMSKIKKAPKKVDFYLLTGDLGKADFARNFYFDNIKRKQQGLSEREYGSKESKKAHDQIHYSTIEVLNYLSKLAPVYSLQGNVGIATRSDSRKLEREYGLKHPSTLDKIQNMRKVSLVKNRLRILEGLKIGFLEYFVDTSWVKEFEPEDYKKIMRKSKKQSKKAKRVLSSFKDLDILVCHQPPYGILDKVNFPGAPKNWQGKHAGSKIILDYIKEYQPKYVFCGHIHEGEGYKKVGQTKIYNLGVAGRKIIDL